MTLHHCGTENPDHAKFCSGCGEPVAAPSKKACAACGGDNEPGARFCSHCGAGMQSTEMRPSTVAPSASSPSWKYAAAVGVMLVALGIAWAAWFVNAKPAAGVANTEARTEARSETRKSIPSTSSVTESAVEEKPAKRIARIQEVHGKKPIGAQSPRAACAGSENFLSRSICETNKCTEAAYAKHPVCVELFERQHQNDRLRREGYVQ